MIFNQRGVLLLSVLLAGAFSPVFSQRIAEAPPGLLPAHDEIAGLTAADTARIFRGEELYRHIDGGADLFFEYGFKEVVVQDYDQPVPLNCEIYEMSDPAAAYGIYSVRSGADAAPLNIGDGGGRTSYYIMFWKGPYYVTVAGSDTTQASQNMLERIARSVDRKIARHSSVPAIVQLLPEEGLITKRYFRGILGLSSSYIFDTKDIFRALEGATGVYNTHVIMLFGYHDSTDAKAACARVDSSLFVNVRFRELRRSNGLSFVKDRGDHVLCFGRRGSILIVALGRDERGAEEAWRDIRTR